MSGNSGNFKGEIAAENNPRGDCEMIQFKSNTKKM